MAANDTSTSPTLTLLRSAFGPSSTLYTVLQCTASSTAAELKRAYRKAALRYHPDRCCNGNEGNTSKSGAGECDSSSSSKTSSSTLKFQAVSAAYQILMDEKRRLVYDKTGRIVEDDDDEGGAESHHSASPRKAPPRRGGRGGTRNQSNQSQSQRQWEQFFHSIFDEIISTGSNHATSASSYRGSSEEREDVLHYYVMCKGDMKKVSQCILHGNAEDVVRWRREIVAPAVKRGELDDYDYNYSNDNVVPNGKKKKKSNGKDKSNNNKQRRVILEDSSSEEEEISKVSRSASKKRLGKGKRNKNNSLLLIDDTDDDEEEKNDVVLPRKQTSIISNNSGTTRRSNGSNNGGNMSKRDKMNYRVAKKRKVKAAKEMEMADILQSKNWDIGTAAAAAASQQRGTKKQKNMGGISDAFLSSIERKYGGEKKKRRKGR